MQGYIPPVVETVFNAPVSPRPLEHLLSRAYFRATTRDAIGDQDKVGQITVPTQRANSTGTCQ